MATKSGGTDKTVLSGEARGRNAWVWAGWWKSPLYKPGLDLRSATVFLVGWDPVASLIPPRMDGIRWQPRIPGGRATEGERRVTPWGWQAPAQGLPCPKMPPGASATATLS